MILKTVVGINMHPGRYTDIPIEDYHRLDALGSTNVRAAMRSWAHFERSKQESKEYKHCWDFGNAVHLALLQPDIFKTNVVRASEGIRRGSNAWKELERNNPGKIILKPKSNPQTINKEPGYDDIQTIQFNMHERESRRNNPFLSNGEPEVTYIWIDPETGLKCKCRPDWIRRDGIVIDLKTCPDGKAKDSDTYIKEVKQYGYHIQKGMYLEGVNVVEEKGEWTDSWLIPIEKKDPFLINEFHLPKEMLEIGNAIFHTQLRRIKEYYDSNKDYLGYPIDVVDEHGDILDEKELYDWWMVDQHLQRNLKEIDYGN